MPLIRIILIAMFLTASHRLLPLPFSDTIRTALFAIIIFLSGIDKNFHLNITFIRRLAPLLLTLLLTLLIDIAFGRFGFFSALIWVQFISAILVANTLYNMPPGDMRKIIICATAILILQFFYMTLLPSHFAAMARKLGIADSFVTYGTKITRIYYAYFNANSAAYSIWFLFLSWFAVNIRTRKSKFQYFGISGLLIVLAILTGGRGVILLMGGFLFAWLLAFRSTAAMTFVTVASLGGVVVMPLFNTVVGFILLREDSNEARLHAMENYIRYIQENPLLGAGIQEIRNRVVNYGLKPSHNFFLEIFGIFGVVFGSIILIFLIYNLILRPYSIQYRLIGVFGLAAGIFNNTLLTNWGFFPLFIPVVMALGPYSNTLKVNVQNPIRPPIANVRYRRSME